MFDWLGNISILFQQGGLVLWSILAASLMMWVFILERYYFFIFELPTHRQAILWRWRHTPWQDNCPKSYIQACMQTAFESHVKRHLNVITVLIDVLPLLGLLGTITGMIKVFDVITLFGAGNARGMAAGISEALITTMAGLVTALSGFYFSVNLKSFSARQTQAFENQLKSLPPKTHPLTQPSPKTTEKGAFE